MFWARIECLDVSDNSVIGWFLASILLKIWILNDLRCFVAFWFCREIYGKKIWIRISQIQYGGGKIWGELLGWSSRCWRSLPTLSSSSWSDNYHHHHCHDHWDHSSWLLWLSWSCSWWLSPSHHHLQWRGGHYLGRHDDHHQPFDYHHHLHHGEGVYYQFIGIAWMIMVVQVIIIIRYLILCRYLQETFDFNQCNQSLFGKKGLCLVIGWCGLGLMIVTWTTGVAFDETYYVYLHVISFELEQGSVSEHHHHHYDQAGHHS